MTDVTPPPAPAGTPIWEDFIDIFTSPSAVFARRQEDPNFVPPWLVFSLVVAAIVLLGWSAFEPVMHADTARAMEKMIASNPNLPPEMVERMRSGNMPGAAIAKYIVPVAAAMIVLLVGLITWVGGKIVGAVTTIGQAMMVAAYAYFPKIIDSVAQVVLAMTLPDSMLTTAGHLKLGPSMALDPDHASLLLSAFVTRLDLFTLWTTVLIAIGLKVTGKLSTQKAAIAAVIVWLLGAVVPVLGALRAG